MDDTSITGLLFGLLLGRSLWGHPTPESPEQKQARRDRHEQMRIIRSRARAKSRESLHATATHRREHFWCLRLRAHSHEQ